MRQLTRIVLTMALAIGASVFFVASPASATVNQVSGFADADVGCSVDGFGGGWDYVIPVNGDLVGCIYGDITEVKELPQARIYMEVADETFVGNYGSLSGTFELVEDFIIKFDKNGTPVWARCHHPIVANSGTGDFAGVTGRLDFSDDFSNPDAPVTTYKGHLKFN